MTTTTAPPPGPGACAETTLSHLFRHSLRAGHTHPLLHVLRRHRGETAPLQCRHVTAPPAPRLPIDDAALRQRLRQLPALPQAVQQALAAVGDEHASLDECARHIERDHGIAAATLKLANSAFFGVAGRIASVRDAIDVLGLRNVTMILTSAALASRFGGVRCAGFEFAAFWRHAVATGVAARALAQRCRVDPTLAFTAGLLHDIGRLALALRCPAELAAALAWAAEADVQPADAEHVVLGVDHAQIGAALAAEWKFPAEVVAAIGGHHAPPPGGSARVAEVVHVADAIAHALGLADDGGEAVPPLDAASCMHLAVEAPQLLAVLAEVESGVDEVCRVLAA